MPTLNEPIQTKLKVLVATEGLAASIEAALSGLGRGARSTEALSEFVAGLEGGEEVAPVIAGLVRLAAASVSREKTLDELSQAIIGSNKFSELEVSQLHSFFQSVFALPIVDGVAAYSQIVDLERPFSGASLVTDIRPIVSSGLEPKVTSFALVHQLRLRYEQVDGYGETYVSLTSKELKVLYEQIEAAIKKEDAIRSTLQSGALGTEIGPGEE